MEIPEATDARAALVAGSMGMTPEEFDAHLYRVLAQKYADDVAQASGETAIKQNREETLKEMCESLVLTVDKDESEGAEGEDEGEGEGGGSDPAGTALTTLSDYGVAAGGR